MTQPVPQSIRRIGHGIEIVWSDGATGSYSPRLLRAEEVAPLTIAGMKPMGQYAYSIEFSDGHSSGIYTLEYLRELGGPAAGSALPVP